MQIIYNSTFTPNKMKKSKLLQLIFYIIEDYIKVMKNFMYHSSVFFYNVFKTIQISVLTLVIYFVIKYY